MKKLLPLFTAFFLLSSVIYAQVPTISSFSPVSAVTGTTITITGTNFNTTASNNAVFLGNIRATVGSASATSLSVTVPARAMYGAVTVVNTATGLAVASRTNFTPVFSPSKSTLSTTDFAAKQDFGTGANPFGVAVGDIDGDGIPDIVTANSNANTISILLNNGSGSTISFSTKVDRTTGNGPSMIALGDLNNDGKSDIAISNRNVNTVSVFQNTSTLGNVSFALRQDFTSGTTPYGIRISDLDNDGKMDLVAVNENSNTISVFKNTSSGGTISLAVKVDFATGNIPVGLGLGDIDGDGKIEIVTSNYGDNSISVLRNTSTVGTISFDVKQDFATGANPFNVIVADIDGDGKNDIATPNYGSGTISAYRNTGAIGTVSFAARQDFTVGNGPTGIAVSDISGDGKPDLATANQSDNSISILRNNGIGGTISFNAKLDLPTGNFPRNVAIADIDGDGKQDLVTGNQNANTASVLRNVYIDADLSALSVTGVGLNPSFSAAVTTYSTTVNPIITTVKVTASVSNSSAAMQVRINDGTYVSLASGVQSDDLALNYGPNTIDIKVTAENSTIQKIYTITVVRLRILDATGISVASANSPAFSLRRLSSNYTGPAITVRRSSDNTTADIGFTADGDLNTAALLTFTGSGNGYVTRWYDQNGTSFDLFQADTSKQPIIVTAGVVNTVNKRPAVYFNGTNLATTATVIFPSSVSMTAVAKGNSATSSALMTKTGSGANNLNHPGPFDFTNNGGEFTFGNASTTNFGFITLANNSIRSTVGAAIFGFSIQPSAMAHCYLNGTEVGTAASIPSYEDGGNPMMMGNRNGNNDFSDMYVSEALVYARILNTTERNTVESSQRNYYFNINADLSALTTTAGNLSPVFASGTTSYAISVVNAVNSVTITPTTTNVGATVQVRVNNGTYTTLSSGNASGTLALITGTNSIDVKVTAQEGNIIKVYTITVTRLSNNANLSSLTTTIGTLTPAFSSGTTNYTASVTNDVTSMTITPVTSDSAAIIAVRINSGTYNTVSSGNASNSLALNEGANTIEAKVTAVDGTINTYTIIVSRAYLPPTITSFTPTTASMGTTVTITGSNFNAVTTGNIVFFGATKATVTAATATSLTVTVPVGATYSPISVLNTDSGFSAYSQVRFIPMFTPSRGNITTADFNQTNITGSFNYIASIGTGDFDGDGKADIIGTNSSSGRLVALRNTGSVGNVSFASPVNTNTSTNPSFITVGDINGDGKQDVIHTTSGSVETVSIYPSTSTVGTISFGSRYDIQVSSYPTMVNLADFNKDGRIDIVVSNLSDMMVFRNTGSGGDISFAAGVTVLTGLGCAGIVTADFDGDGKTDVATVNNLDSTISILRNTSSGDTISFDPKVDFATGLNPYSIAVGDMNEDGKYDLLTGGFDDNKISVFRNMGTPGTIAFAARVEFTLPNSGSNAIAVGDLDASGKLDFVVTNGNDVSIFRNTGTGGSVNFAAPVSFTQAIDPSSLLLSDVDGDGKSDIVAMVKWDNKMAVFRNTPAYSVNNNLTSLSMTASTLSPAFSQATISYTATVANSVTGIKITPTLADGTATIKIRINGGTYTALGNGVQSGTLALNVGTNTINIQVTAEDAITIKIYTITVTRISNDADLSGLTTTASFFLPAFSSSTLAYTASVINSVTSATVTPVKSSSVASIAVRIGANSYVAVASGNASAALALSPGSNTINIRVTAQDNTVKTYTLTVTRNFPSPTITVFSPASGVTGATITITGTNFNTTAANNVVFFGATRAAVSAATATSLTVTVPVGATYAPITVLNTDFMLSAYSQSKFRPVFTPSLGNITYLDIASGVDFSTSGGYSTNSAISDIDGDGKADVIIINRVSTGSISVRRNTGSSGTISLDDAVNFATGQSPYGMAVGDVDGDGKPDIITSNTLNSISILRNISTVGNIAFENKVDYTIGSSAKAIVISDLNGDGKPDLALINVNNPLSSVTVFRNACMGNTINFVQKTNYSLVFQHYGMTVSDLNNDGYPDLVACGAGGKIGIFPNAGSNDAISFNTQVNLTVSSDIISSITTGDLDGDGKSDLAMTYLSDSKASILRNTSSGSTISFAPKVDVTTVSGEEKSISLGDIDGDGRADLIVCGNNGVNMSILRNTGSIGTISFANHVTPVTAQNPLSTSIGDIDGDGKPDIVYTRNGTTFSVLRNNPNYNTDNNLSSLTTTAGALSQAFTAHATAYTVPVPTTSSTVTVTPTVSNSTATVQVRVNGGVYSNTTSGIPSSAQSLNIGSNTIDIKVTAQDGVSVKIYTITVIRVSVNADLSSLTTTAGTLSPSFATGTLTYTTIAANASITVTPTVADANATLKVRLNGGTYNTTASGTPSTAMSLNLGVNTIDVKVTAQDGLTVKVYTIAINNNNCSVTTTWNNNAWSNGLPDGSKAVEISGNYTVTADLPACSLTINNNAVVSVASGYDVNVNGSISVGTGASLTFENNANLLQSQNTVNSGNITFKRDAQMSRQDYVYWSSPVSGQNLLAFSPETLVNRFYAIDEPTNDFVPIVPSTTSFALAKGYVIRAPNTIPNPPVVSTFHGSFTGVPNNGDIQIPVTVTGQGYNLIGNPYPSPIDGNLFLAQNPGTLYFWTHTNQGAASGANYATWNQSGGTASIAGGQTPNGMIQTGQGFIIRKASSGNAVFANSMRTGNNAGQFYRNGNEVNTVKSRVWLNLSTDTTPMNQIMFGYMDNATNGFDLSYDGKIIGSGSAISTIINNENYVIQARALPFETTDTVPMHFTAATAGTYKIAIDHKDGLFAEGQNIYLKDNLMNVIQDLNQSGYTFASDEGSFANRFEIIYENAPLGTAPVLDAESVVIYKQENSIHINAGTTVISEIKIFDVRGRMVYKKESADTSNVIINDLLAEQQVLLVQITSKDGSRITKRIVF